MLDRIANILVVDDDDAVRGAAVRQLNSLGHHVAAAASGAEGLAVLEGDPSIDLLFIDLTMPGMGGLEVAERAVRARPNLKVLFTSGDFGTEAAGVGAHLIVKPYRKKELAEKIEETLIVHIS